MSRKAIIYMVLSILLTVYLAVGITLCDIKAAQDRSVGVKIHLVEPENRFVKAEDALNRIREVCSYTAGVPVYSIDLDTIESHLNKFDNIEWANVVRKYSGDSVYISVDIQAMQPVARLIDRGESYYVNRDGKRLIADYAFRADVPVLIAHLDSAEQMREYLPLLDFVKSNKDYDNYFTSFSVARNGDIIAVPMISNHVINLGKATNLENKIRRLNCFYSAIMKKKGWEYYDTISLKWEGQVVATKRKKASPIPIITAQPDSTEMEGEMEEGVVPLPEGETGIIKKNKKKNKKETKS